MPLSVTGAGWNGYATNICLPLAVSGRGHDGRALPTYQKNMPYLRLVRFQMGSPATVFKAQVQHDSPFFMQRLEPVENGV